MLWVRVSILRVHSHTHTLSHTHTHTLTHTLTHTQDTHTHDTRAMDAMNFDRGRECSHLVKKYIKTEESDMLKQTEREGKKTY